MFSRVAIINRGEAAMRLIHAVRELNAERGTQLRTIAFHIEAERGAMFAREADETECIGPPPEGQRDERPTTPYLDHRELERALRRCRADAAWVGWGFVAEDPAFVDLCERLGVTFIGPGADVMRRLGDKIQAKAMAEEAGIPVAAWSGGPVADVDAARRHAQAIGFPVMVKATAGGGGRGIRMVSREPELADAFARARSEAQTSFGDPTVFMERLLTGVRHVEVQLIGDNHGTVWALGVRDCSVQRRNQKLIEESASTALTAEQEGRLRRAAVTLAVRTGYRNAGTVEFLYQPATGTLAFLEVNPRLQVEHPVTEATTGVDLVKLQLQVAMGERLVGEPPPPWGHAMEARLNAEDPDRGFAPAPGAVELLSMPNGPGVRVDTGISEGDVIPPEFDSMVAKVIAWGRDRDEARARLHRALFETTVLIRDGTTNKAFLIGLLDRPELRSGEVDTAWLDRLAAHDPTRNDSGAVDALQAVALVTAAIETAGRSESIRRVAFLAAAARGRPELDERAGETVELRGGGQTYRLDVLRSGPADHRVEMDGRRVDVRVERLTRWARRVTVGDTRCRALVQRQRSDLLVDLDGVAHRFALDDGGIVRAPAAGVVVLVHARPGDTVAAGDRIVVLESMKMEVAITAPSAGRVREILATANVQVGAGAPLVRLDPIEASAMPSADAGRRVRLGGPADPGGCDGERGDRGERGERRADGEWGGDGADASQRGDNVGRDNERDASADTAVAGCLTRLEALRHAILGFERSTAEVAALVEQYERLRARLPSDHPDLLAGELRLLDTFADLSVLWRNRRGDDDLGADEEARSPSEYLNTYLRSLDVEREGLPTAFRSRLLQALGHYGITDLTRTPELEEALYWVYHAQRRAPEHMRVILRLVEQRLGPLPRLSEALPEEVRTTLDRLIVATQLRYPMIGDLARSIRYRWFDEPLIRRSAEAVLDEMRAHLAYLDANPEAPDRPSHVESLVSCPQPLLRLLAGRPPSRGRLEPMLEVLTRRYYKIRFLTGVVPSITGGINVVVAAYPRRGRTVHVIAAYLAVDELPRASAPLAVLVDQVPRGDTCVVELYVHHGASRPEAAEPAREVHPILEALVASPSVTRVTVTDLAERWEDERWEAERDGAPTHLTFRRSGARFEEDTVVRGLHPMIARRLQLWRLTNFRISRLASSTDSYVFHCVAPDNPADERFIAVAEVRDLTPVRDGAGCVTSLPELEHVLAVCLDGLRRAQADRPPAARPTWNRVVLHLWPPAPLPLDELLPVAGNLVPLTTGLGLEAVLVQGRFALSAGDAAEDRVLRLAYQPGTGLSLRVTEPPTAPMQPLDAYTQKVIQARRRGATYPHELVALLTRAPDGSVPGTFVEHDLDEGGRLVPVDRPAGGNMAGIVVGVVTTPTPTYPEGMVRVALFGDPTRSLGSIAEAECRRVIAALDLAACMGVPVEWFALSAGARIAMDSGTENLDWVARALRRLVEFTQGGGEVNVVVAGINVGAQPYWNAEATMLMHTRGILVMTPDSAMVLTGKQALEYSGGVSAEDNAGIGGYERIMGPNGEAQHWAPDLAGACDVLLAHHSHAYVAPGERFPRRAASGDPVDRDVCAEPHVLDGSELHLVGDIFSEVANPGRKKPFDMRTVMRATLDRDRPPLERWAGMREADTVIVFDGHLGGWPVSMLGVESRPLPRFGALPADGPDQWTAGTLFPLSSKKMARAINAASGTRPLVILANLSGFDGSPESLRRAQLEHGAEIGRAIVNFDGPIVFCVVSRYHGGAFVVFSATLNDRMEVIAVEGSHASVIGGAPAAAVVFTGEVTARTRADPRVVELESRAATAPEPEAAAGRTETWERVRLEKLGEVAAEFDAIHTVERAMQVGSVHRIVPAARLRPSLVEAVERGIHRTLGQLPPEGG